MGRDGPLISNCQIIFFDDLYFCVLGDPLTDLIEVSEFIVQAAF